MPSSLCRCRTAACAGFFGEYYVVAQQDRERLVADVFFRPQYGVAEAERFLLTDIVQVDHFRDIFHLMLQILLSAVFKGLLQFEAPVEWSFYGAFAAACDYQDVVDAGCHALLDHQLYARLVY